MAALESLPLVLFFAITSGVSPFLAQRILRDRLHKKRQWEKCGLESLIADPRQPGSKRFIEYIRWAIPLQAVSRELAETVCNHLSRLDTTAKCAIAKSVSSIAALPADSDIQKRYELNTALSLPIPIVATLCAACGSVIAMATVVLGTRLELALVLAVICAACAVMVLTDLSARLIPDCITLVLFICGVALQLLRGTALLHGALSLVCGIFFLAICLAINRISADSVIGGGDCKSLLALPVVTAVTGLLPALIVMLGCLTGTLVLSLLRRGRKALGNRIPLAPYISAAMMTGAIWQAI